MAICASKVPFGGVSDTRSSGTLHDNGSTISDRLNGSLWTFGGALGEQPFVDVALHVGVHRRPLFHVDQIHDQSPQRRRILNFWSSLLEDFPQHSRLLAEFFEAVPVMVFEFVALPFQEALPAELRRDDGRSVIRRPRLLVDHLEKEQKRDLLSIGHVRQTIVPQN